MLAMMLLLLQGSDSGVIVACTVMGVCFWLDRKQTGHWEVYFLFLQRWRWECAVGVNGCYIWERLAFSCRMASPKTGSLAGMDSGCSRVSAALGSLSQDSGE